MVSQIDYAVIAAVVAGCACWIEHGHRIVIDAPTLSELAAPSSAAACPDNDRVPYSERSGDASRKPPRTPPAGAVDFIVACKPAPIGGIGLQAAQHHR